MRLVADVHGGNIALPDRICTAWPDVLLVVRSRADRLDALKALTQAY